MLLKSTPCYLKQHQIIGNNEPFDQIQQEDMITSLQFNATGDLLAIGDNAGRIIIFKQQQQSEEQQCFQHNYQIKKSKKMYQYHSEFQSHTLEFDTLKSMRMEEKIKVLKFLPSQGKYHKMITSNSHRIKLFKLYQKQESKVILTGQRRKNSIKQLTQQNPNIPTTKSIHNINNKSSKHISMPQPASKTSIPSTKQLSDDLAIPLLEHSTTFTAQPSIIFPIKHQTEINNVELSNNQQYIFSTDSNKALLWSIEKPEMPFVVESINDNMNGFTSRVGGGSYGIGGVQSLSSISSMLSSISSNHIVKKHWSDNQTISCSKFHTVNDNIFLIGSTKGNIQLNDIRQSFHKRNNLNFGICHDSYSNKQSNNIHISHNFTQMTKKINSLTFLPQNNRYVISRDYLTIKIWDISLPSHPLKTIQQNPSLLPHLSRLFQHQCLQDQFSLSSYQQNHIITGSYDNRFNMINPITEQNYQYKMSFNHNEWKRGKVSNENINTNNNNSDNNSYIRNTSNKDMSDQNDCKFKYNFDINRKIQKTAVCKRNKKVALASLNSVIVYEQDQMCNRIM